jgi:hypothetical protein
MGKTVSTVVGTRSVINDSVHTFLSQLKKRKDIADFSVIFPQNKMEQNVDVRVFVTGDKTVKFKAGPECTTSGGVRQTLAGALSSANIKINI